MTNEEIRSIKQKVYEIQTAPPSGEQLQRIEDIAKRTGASLPEWLHTQDPTSRKNINFIAKNIHTVLQTEMMFNACVSAKWSCLFAAIASIVACVSIILTLCLN